MNVMKPVFFWLLMSSSGSILALPSADIAQTNYCRGVIAETKPNGTGNYLVGTYLNLLVGPLGNKKWLDFVDDDNWGSTQYLEAKSAYSRAGCENCLLDNEYRYNRLAVSEHFWQEHEYAAFNEYCPHTQTFGTWLPGDYCESLTREHASCTPI